MEIYYPDSNRIGRFNVLYETLRNDPELMGALFSICVILGVEDSETGHGKTYYAASLLFEPLLDGEEVPEYRIESTAHERFEDEFLEQRRVSARSPFSFAAVRKTIVRVPAVQLTHKVH